MRPLTSRARRTRRRVRGWSLRLLEPLEWVFLGTIAACGVSLLAIVLSAPVRFFVGDIGANGTFLLSSIAQGLAAILTVLITLTLVATQLSAASYTPRTARRRLTDPWLWMALLFYGAAIAFSLIALSSLGPRSHS